MRTQNQGLCSIQFVKLHCVDSFVFIKYRSKDFYEFMMLVEMELSRIKTIIPETSSTHDLHIPSYIRINCYYFPMSKYT